MKREAEMNAEADKKEKETIEKVNAADSMIFQTEKQLKEYSEKISASNKTNIENALNRLKEAHKARNTEEIDSAMQDINKAWEGAAQEMYAQSGGAQQQGPFANAGGAAESQEPKGSGPDVSDVEYEEVNDKDKK